MGIFKQQFKYEPIYVAVTGLIIHYIFYLIIPSNYHEVQTTMDTVVNAFITLAITFIIWYGSFSIDNYLDEKFPWDKHIFQHIFFQIILTAAFTAIVILYAAPLFHTFLSEEAQKLEDPVPTQLAMVISLLIAFLITTINTGKKFFLNWKKSALEAEKYKKESIEARYETLKNQVNPHFLFNSFSVLSSLISLDSEKAETFVNKLSKVYRYTLDNNDKELIELSRELNFIESYIYLLETRFGTNLKVNINIDDELKQLLILPISLQMLIENAVKHNVISKNKKLVVDVYINDLYLVVSNNLQLRIPEDNSTKIGLNNIENRYKYFTDRNVIINESLTCFTVKLPLLKITK